MDERNSVADESDVNCIAGWQRMAHRAGYVQCEGYYCCVDSQGDDRVEVELDWEGFRALILDE